MTKEKDKLLPSTITGNTDKPLPTATQIEEYAKELGISVAEFMKRYYLSDSRQTRKKITISGNRKK